LYGQNKRKIVLLGALWPKLRVSIRTARPQGAHKVNGTGTGERVDDEKGRPKPPFTACWW